MSGTAAAVPAIELAGFTKSFPMGWRGARVGAVHGLSLAVAPGQVLGLLGPNGSGKTTTLKALAGLIRPTSGACRIFGEPAGSDAARAQVGYVPEAVRFSSHLSGREFLHYCAGLSSMDPKTAGVQVEEAWQWTNLDHVADRRIATYSRGMMQRLALAQAILHDPTVILLDEPTNGLDPGSRLVFAQLIRDLATKGKTVVLSSHVLPQVAELCDQLAILDRGRLLVAGSRAELLGAAAVTAPEPSPLEKLYLEKLPAHA